MLFQNLKRKKPKQNKPKKLKILFGAMGVTCALLGTVSAFWQQDIQADTKQITYRLIPSGQAVGMRLKTKGAMVVGIEQGDLPAKKAGLKNGDVITKVNDMPLQNTRHFEEILRTVGENTMTLTVLRDDSFVTLKLTPKRNQANQLVCGMWLRDSAAGIGTVTFFTEDQTKFAALGHPVNDSDTLKTYDVRQGQVELVEIKGAKKAEQNRVGELVGVLSDIPVGTVTKNCETGLMGSLENKQFIQREAIPVAAKREVKLGKATILSTVSEAGTCEYEIEIIKILDGKGNRDMILHVMDKNLLSQTGGIVQGMSGSPIIQNGKIVGAVTHVLVNDPTRGYGIFIENMLAEVKK